VDRYIVPIELKLHANALSEWRVGAVSILRETCEPIKMTLRRWRYGLELCDLRENAHKKGNGFIFDGSRFRNRRIRASQI
jgi:hypothetical protein